MKEALHVTVASQLRTDLWAGRCGLSTALFIGRGREAMAFEGGTLQALQPPDDGVIHIDSNETVGRMKGLLVDRIALMRRRAPLTRRLQ
jgi:hypothetical protein